MGSVDLTRRALVTGAADTVTGHLAKSFTTYTIQGSIQPKGAVFAGLKCGAYAKYPQTLFTPDTIHDGDEIIDAYTNYYLVKTVDSWSWTDQFSHNVCELIKTDPHYDRASTSGTWHLDSDNELTDPRYRIKAWINSNIETIYKDDAATTASTLLVFDGVDHPYKAYFDAGYDVIGVITCKPSKPRESKFHKVPYGFDEQTEIVLYAIHKTDVTAQNILERYYQAIRKAMTDHSDASVNLRSITSDGEPEQVDLGGLQAYGVKINIQYSRYNDDFLPTTPSITWGPSAAPTGTFILPNVIYISTPIKANNVRMHPPSSMGSVVQKLGMPDFMITIRCDLDFEHADLSWKRPQTTTATDVFAGQVFWDILFNGQYDGTQTYQTLNLGWGSTLKVTLEEVNPIQSANTNQLELVFMVYNTASATAYKTMFGISP